MSSEGLGKMFEGDSADMCVGKFPLMLMGGRAEGLACSVKQSELMTSIMHIILFSLDIAIFQ